MALIDRTRAVQDIAWPDGTCFGCGPANADGLQLKSYLSDDGEHLVASFNPNPIQTSGMANVAYGGFIASLVDCHSIWTATTFAHIAEARPLSDGFIPYVTGELNVQFRKPTPLDRPIHLRSYVEGEIGRKTRVTCEVGIDDDVTAVGDVLAVRMEDTSREKSQLGRDRPPVVR